MEIHDYKRGRWARSAEDTRWTRWKSLVFVFITLAAKNLLKEYVSDQQSSYSKINTAIMRMSLFQDSGNGYVDFINNTIY